MDSWTVKHQENLKVGESELLEFYNGHISIEETGNFRNVLNFRKLQHVMHLQHLLHLQHFRHLQHYRNFVKPNYCLGLM